MAWSYYSSSTAQVLSAGTSPVVVNDPTFTPTSDTWTLRLLNISYRGAVRPLVDTNYWTLLHENHPGNTSNGTSSALGAGAIYYHLGPSSETAPTSGQRTLTRPTSSNRTITWISAYAYDGPGVPNLDNAGSFQMASSPSSGRINTTNLVFTSIADALIVGTVQSGINDGVTEISSGSPALTSNVAVSNTNSTVDATTWRRRAVGADGSSPSQAMTAFDVLKPSAGSIGNTYFDLPRTVRNSVVLGAFGRLESESGYPEIYSTTLTIEYVNATTLRASLPVTIDAGDMLVVSMAVDGNTPITWDHTTAGTWTEIANITYSSSCRLATYYKIADGTEGGKTLGVTVSSGEQSVARCWRIKNASAIEFANQTGASSTTVTMPALNPSWGTSEKTRYIVAASLDGATKVSSYFANYQAGTRYGSSTSGLSTLATATRTLQGNQASTTMTLTSGVPWALTVMAIRPAADITPSANGTLSVMMEPIVVSSTGTAITPEPSGDPPTHVASYTSWGTSGETWSIQIPGDTQEGDLILFSFSTSNQEVSFWDWGDDHGQELVGHWGRGTPGSTDSIGLTVFSKIATSSDPWSWIYSDVIPQDHVVISVNVYRGVTSRPWNIETNVPNPSPYLVEAPTTNANGSASRAVIIHANAIDESWDVWNGSTPVVTDSGITFSRDSYRQINSNNGGGIGVFSGVFTGPDTGSTQLYLGNSWDNHADPIWNLPDAVAVIALSGNPDTPEPSAYKMTVRFMFI